MKITKEHLAKIIAEETAIAVKNKLKEQRPEPVDDPDAYATPSGTGLRRRAGAVTPPQQGGAGTPPIAGKDVSTRPVLNPGTAPVAKPEGQVLGMDPNTLGGLGVGKLELSLPDLKTPTTPEPTPESPAPAETTAPVKPTRPVDRSGMTKEAHDVTKEIQQKLVKAGLLIPKNGKPADDGVFGKDTEKALAEWFKKNPNIKRPGGKNFLEAIRNINKVMGELPSKESSELPSKESNEEEKKQEPNNGNDTPSTTTPSFPSINQDVSFYNNGNANAEGIHVGDGVILSKKDQGELFGFLENSLSIQNGKIVHSKLGEISPSQIKGEGVLPNRVVASLTGGVINRSYDLYDDKGKLIGNILKDTIINRINFDVKAGTETGKKKNITVNGQQIEADILSNGEVKYIDPTTKQVVQGYDSDDLEYKLSTTPDADGIKRYKIYYKGTLKVIQDTNYTENDRDKVPSKVGAVKESKKYYNKLIKEDVLTRDSSGNLVNSQGALIVAPKSTIATTTSKTTPIKPVQTFKTPEQQQLEFSNARNFTFMPETECDVVVEKVIDLLNYYPDSADITSAAKQLEGLRGKIVYRNNKTKGIPAIFYFAYKFGKNKLFGDDWEEKMLHLSGKNDYQDLFSGTKELGGSLVTGAAAEAGGEVVGVGKNLAKSIVPTEKGTAARKATKATIDKSKEFVKDLDLSGKGARAAEDLALASEEAAIIAEKEAAEKAAIEAAKKAAAKVRDAGFSAIDSKTQQSILQKAEKDTITKGTSKAVKRQTIENAFERAKKEAVEKLAQEAFQEAEKDAVKKATQVATKKTAELAAKRAATEAGRNLAGKAALKGAGKLALKNTGKIAAKAGLGIAGRILSGPVGWAVTVADIANDLAGPAAAKALRGESGAIAFNQLKATQDAQKEEGIFWIEKCPNLVDIELANEVEDITGISPSDIENKVVKEHKIFKVDKKYLAKIIAEETLKLYNEIVL